MSPSPPVRLPNDCCPRKRHVWGTRQSRWFRGPAALLCVRAARRVLRPARIRILTAHAPICSRIYLPASSRRQRELGATNLGLDPIEAFLFLPDALKLNLIGYHRPHKSRALLRTDRSFVTVQASSRYRRCLLLALSGHADVLSRCPLLGVKRTSDVRP